MTLRKLFTGKMFFVVLLPIVIIALLLVCETTFSFGIGSYGFNKTVGWAWDITALIDWVLPFNLVYLLGYSALALFKIKTNYFISGVHFILITLSFIFFGGRLFDWISFYAILLSPFLFIANIIFSLINHKKLKDSRI